MFQIYEVMLLITLIEKGVPKIIEDYKKDRQFGSACDSEGFWWILKSTLGTVFEQFGFNLWKVFLT